MTDRRNDPAFVGDWQLSGEFSGETFARIIVESNGEISIRTALGDLESEFYGTWQQLEENGRYEIVITKQFSNIGDVNSFDEVDCKRKLMLRCGLCDDRSLMLENLVPAAGFFFGDSSDGKMLPPEMLIPQNHWRRTELSSVIGILKFQNKPGPR